MTEFKVGDRVRIKEGIYPRSGWGCEGVVTGFNGSNVCTDILPKLSMSGEGLALGKHSFVLVQENEKTTPLAGTKHDQGKPRTELLPFDVLEAVAVVLSRGAEKYSDRNWEKGFKWSRLLGAVLRHLFSWAKGGDRIDPEWGLSHLDHALCALMMLRAHELRGIGEDDMKGEK